jgi:hypothetical protein
MPDLDQMNPEMDQTNSPEMGQDAQDYSQPDGGHDREGAMAKADLYKLATYSHKLFKQLHDNDQMEAWVQAKITKAADYIASVYHYLEYEMKFSEYGHHLDNSDTLSEGQKMKIKEVLAEAKEKMKELKKSQAEKMKAKKVEEGILSGGERPCTECGGTGMVYEEPKEVPAHVKSKVDAYKRLTKATHAAHKRLDANNNGIPDDEEEMDEEFTDKSKTGDTFKTRTGVATKTDKGVKHTNTSYKDDGEAEEKSGKGIKSHAKAQSAAEKKEKAPAQKQSPKSAKTWGMKDGEKFDNRDKQKDESVFEAKKKKGDGNLANNYPPFDKVTRGDVIAGATGKDQKGGKKPMKEGMSAGDMAHYHACKCAECYEEGMLEAAMHHKDMCEQHGGTIHIAQGKCHHCHPHINGGAMYECGSNMGGMMYESEKPGTKKSKPCPPMSHIKKMCQDGKSMQAICKMHPDCDQNKLKKMVADCKKRMDEAKPSAGLSKGEKSAVVKKAKAGGDIGKPGKSFDKLAKSAGGGEKGKKIAAAAMWKNIKETTAYMAEKAMIFENAYKNIGTTAFQNWLNDHGFQVPVTGIFDTATQAAEQAAYEKVRASSDSEYKEFIDMLSVGTAYNVIPGHGVSLDTIGPILSKYGYDAKTGKKAGGGMMPSTIEEKKNLPGKQEKIDVNKNGKIDADDLAKLRAGKKETVKESTDLDRIKSLMQRLNG